MNIRNFDYSFSFNSIQNQYTQVRMESHANGNNDHFSIFINDNALSINGLPIVPSISADLIDLAIAIHATDRLIKRRTGAPLSFRIRLPVRNLEAFTRRDVSSSLAKALEWYTNDCWHFEFSKRDTPGRNVEVQPRLPWMGLPSKKIEVALWSGGLDSLSGLCTRLLGNTETYHILIGTGSNTHVHTKQEQIAHEIKQKFPGRIQSIQIPYGWSRTPSQDKSSTQRARGLVFMLIGAACAYRFGCNSLFIYENGVGAINLPYSRAEVGLDHAKSVHPMSLLYVSELISDILNTSFQLTNPFWLWTKAQMVYSLVETNNTGLINLSFSCDRARRLETGITQCGICSSCLLRRQSLIALNLNDSTFYQNNYDLNKRESHFQVMQFQVNKIRMLLKQSDPWRSLSGEYYVLNDVMDKISLQNGQEINGLRSQIIQMYSRYVDEWKLFEESIKKNIFGALSTYASS